MALLLQYDVFLSHNSMDKPAVEQLAQKLRTAGFTPFLDKWHLIPGQPWQEALEKALDQSRTCAVFLGPGGPGPWENEEMRVALDQRTDTKDFRVIPVLLPAAQMPDKGDLPRFLSRLVWVDFRRGLDDADALYRLSCGIRGIAPGAPDDVDAPTVDICPYRGLEVFTEAHAEFFFGRAALTQWLVERLRANRFLAVIGASGSGKSSVVLAGLIPALRRGALPDSANWEIVIMTPGAHPLETLAHHLLPLQKEPGNAAARLLDLTDRLAADARMLHAAVRTTFANPLADKRLLLIIDQFEELFTLCQDAAEQQRFLDNLLYASGVAQGPTIVVLTLRADFYARAAGYQELGDRLADRQVLITPLVEAELREAIERPAQVAGLTFDVGLVDTLVKEVAAAPGALPLLQHTLFELWERRKGNRLTFAAYHKIGGIQGAIAYRADSVYEKFDETQKLIARRILLRLTQPGQGTEDTRRRAAKIELIADPNQAALVERVVHALVGARLMTITRLLPGAETGVVNQSILTPDQEVVDVAHEALIRGWPRLQGWLNQDRSGFLIHRRLTEAALDWEHHQRADDYLYRGARLIETAEWAQHHTAELNPSERAFLDASHMAVEQAEVEKEASRLRELKQAQDLAAEQQRHAEEQTRFAAQLRRLALGLAMALVVALIALAGFGISFRAARNASATAVAEAAVRATREVEAKEGQVRAERSERAARARQLANQAAFYRDSEPSLALLLAMHAISTTYAVDGYTTLEAGTALRGLLQYSFKEIWNVKLDRMYAIYAVALSPNGKTIVSGGADNRIHIWDVTSRKELHTLEGHTGIINIVVLSPDGNSIVSGSNDSTIRIWDMASGKERQKLAGHTGSVYAVALSLDGKTIVSASDDLTIRIWDIASGKELRKLAGHTGSVYAVALSPDGKTIVSGGADSTIRIWDIASGKELHKLAGHTSNVNVVVLSPDGKSIVSGSNDSTIRVWDMASGKEQQKLAGHTGSVYAVALSPDGKTLISSSFDHTIRIWDMASGKERQKLAGHTGSIHAMVLSPDGKTILSGSDDETIRIWDINTKKPVDFTKEIIVPIHAVTINTDSKIVVSTSGQTIRIQDASSGRELRKLVGHTDTVYGVALSADGKTIVSGSADRTVRIWDADSGRELHKLAGHTDIVYGVALSMDSKTIISGSADRTIRIWDVSSAQELQKLEGHTDTVYGVALSADGKTLISGSADNTVREWNAATGKMVRELGDHLQGVYAVAMSVDDKTIVSGSGEKTVRLWRQTQRLTQVDLSGHQSGVLQAMFNPTGEWVASAGQEGTAYIWNAATGEPLARLKGHGDEAITNTTDCNDCIATIAFHPSAKRVLTAGWDGTARIWDLQTGKELVRLAAAGEGRLIDAIFNPAGTLVATSSADKFVRVWDPDSGKVIHTLNTISGTNTVHFSPDGKLLAAAGLDGQVLLWDATTGKQHAILQGQSGFSFYRVIFSPDSKYVAAAGVSKDAFIWEVATGRRIAILHGHTDSIWQLTYSPDGNLLATASNDKTTRLWNAHTGALHQLLQGHTSGVMSVTFSPNGSQIATGSQDGTVRLWNAETGESEAILPDNRGTELFVNWNSEVSSNFEQGMTIASDKPLEWIFSVNYSLSGDRVVAAGLDSSVTIYVASAQKLLEIARTQVARELTCQERVQFLYEKLDCESEARPGLQLTPLPTPVR